jgi:type VI protein secretion system component Hcp
MIVARICDTSGFPIVASGSCKIDNYDGAPDGWFPIDQFSFGFHAKEEDTDPSAHPAKPPASKQNGTGHAPSPAGGKKGKSDAELRISKLIDTSTCILMTRAMSERKYKKGVAKDQETPITMDIHIISSAAPDIKKARSHFTSLMVHLEAVNIQNWDISGSGDSRPTENVTVRYDRAAMIYVATKDAETFHVVGPKGWDQTENKEWTWNASRMKKYYPPGHSPPNTG